MTESNVSKEPRAIRLDGAEGAGLEDGVVFKRGAVTVLPETEAISPSTPDSSQEGAALPRRRGFGWGTLFVGALSGLMLMAAGLWAERTVRVLLAEYPALGYVALGLAVLALVALLVMLGRIVRDILQERRIARLQEQARTVLAGSDLATAKALAGELDRLYAGRPETAKARAALKDSLPQLFAGSDVLAVAERQLMLPLDALVQAEIAKAARQVSVVTAVSPRAIVDMLFVLVACARLLRRIAAIYGGRPGALGLWRLARNVVGHLAITGGIAAGDAVLQQVLGQGLAARLSAKLGEGVLNGLLTARVGLSAIALCRPLPFQAMKAPGLADVAGDLVSWRGPKAGE